jgi:hypothetical protein
MRKLYEIFNLYELKKEYYMRKYGNLFPRSLQKDWGKKGKKKNPERNNHA